MKRILLTIGLLISVIVAQAQIKGYTLEALERFIFNSDTLRATTQTSSVDTTMATKLYVDAAAGAGIDSVTLEDNYIKLYFDGAVLDSVYLSITQDSTWSTLTISDTLFLGGDTALSIETYDGTGGDNYVLASKEYVDNAASGALSQKVYEITLPVAGTLSASISAAVEGTDYESGWNLSASGGNLEIGHNLSNYVASVTVFYNTSGDAYRQLVNFQSAYNNIENYSQDSLSVISISEYYTQYKLKVYLLFN